jgi:type II secretory pathway pseudopilin PulG
MEILSDKMNVKKLGVVIIVFGILMAGMLLYASSNIDNSTEKNRVANEVSDTNRVIDNEEENVKDGISTLVDDNKNGTFESG